MQQSTATRRLVKSPPELWAEISSEDVLGRHLAEFGEIRITRTSPQTTVAWEGDRASGTVELAPTGWGTKVVLTAQPRAQPDGPREPADDVEAVAPPAPPPEPEAVAPPAPPPEPERVAPPERRPDPPAVQPPATAAEPAPVQPRRGFFARLFRRRQSTPDAPSGAIPGPPVPAPDPSPPPAPDPGPLPPAPDPGPLPPAPDPAPPTPAPAPPAPQIEVLDPERTAAILAAVLDDLGSAHHRPFSRG